MIEYVIQRILYGILVLFIMILFVFVIIRAVPGDVVMLQLADAGTATEAQVEALRTELGLDKNIGAQLVEWFANAARGDFGKSLWTDQPVTEMIVERLPVTLQLGFMSTILAILIGIPMGVIAAVKHNTWVDNLFRVSAIGGLSIPNFWLGLLIVIALVLLFNWMPPLGYRTFFENPWINLQQMVFPALILATGLGAVIVRMTRSALLEVMHSDFIRTVRSKGAKERLVIYKHALRNSLISIISIIGLQVGTMLGGAVVIESIFSLPGLGSLIFESVTTRDYPVVQSVSLLFGGMFVFVNLFVDLTYGWVDPRIRSN